ncbi:Glutaredoxin [gamma proteobacterium HdN1]|nr:Glutaredoxin [gamma proteobacterium HdN1]
MAENASRPLAHVLIYTKPWCPYCIRARKLLKDKGVAFEEIDINGRPELREEMIEKSGRHTVPQIWINTQHVGGCDDLVALERAGELDPLLAVAP